MSILTKNRWLGASFGVVVIVGAMLLLGALLISGSRHGIPISEAHAAASDEGGDSGQEAVSVKAIRPRRDPSFKISVEQPAYVAAYYRADLMARVAGPVSWITHDKGDRVRRGEALVEIDVPDLHEDVRLKEALIVQEQKELELARSREKMAEVAVAVARQVIPIKKSEVEWKEATQRFREKELKRFQGLAAGNSPAATQDIVDERTEFCEAAKAASAAARQTVKEAELNYEESKARLDAARAEVAKRQSMVDVASKDRDKAQAFAGFTTIRAPFDGVITQRNVDPGSFVQNATTAHAEPLLTVERTDIVTVYMKVPDKYAPFVSSDTDASIEMDSLPGVVVRAKLTRSSGSLETPEHDRTMRAEVDLYNGDREHYSAFRAEEEKQHNADLKSRVLPVFPQTSGEPASRGLGLLPEQYGKMRLVLKSFQNDYLVPSSAVISEGGTPYIFLLKNGLAMKVPVQIQADNGEEVKVTLLMKSGNEQRPLTADDEVVASNQGELTDGQAVKATLVDW